MITRGIQAPHGFYMVVYYEFTRGMSILTDILPGAPKILKGKLLLDTYELRTWKNEKIY